MANPSFAEVSILLKYDPATGTLTWLPRPRASFKSLHEHNRWNNRYAGKIAGNSHRSGYIFVGLFGKLWAGHRVAWLLQTGAWPKGEIDHINGMRTDNSATNLRDVDKSSNQRNATIRSDNTSGAVGVRWSVRAGKWHARIQAEGERKHLGYFDTYKEALQARRNAENQYGFHENHGRNRKMTA